MKSENNDAGAEAVMGILVGFVVVAIYFGFFAGKFLNMPPVKSDKEMCEERGGVFVTQHHREPLCLAKEAFK